jgi:hypothetical protein
VVPKSICYAVPWRRWQAFFEFFGGGAESVLIALGEHRSWAVAGDGLKLVAAMRMPFDLDVGDEEAEPEELDDTDELDEDDDDTEDGDDE